MREDPQRRFRLMVFMSKACPWSRHLAGGLQALGAEVHVFDFQDDYESGYVSRRVPGIAADAQALGGLVTAVHLVRPRARGKMRYVLGAADLRKTIARVRPDALFALYGGGYSIASYLSGFRPYFTYAVGSDVLLAGPLMRASNRVTFSRASLVFANGEHLAQRAREQAPGARVMPLLMGVDTSAFSLATPEGPTVRMVCIRGFQPVYNNESVIRALARLPADLPDFRFVFTSGGPQLAKARELAERILPAPVRARVEFLGGVSSQEITQALTSAHVFVSFSRSDGTATALLEGLACGLFPVLSDIPANRPWVDRGAGNGELVALDDEGALARALERVIRDPSRAVEHRSFNRELVVSRADSRASQARLLEEMRSHSVPR